VNHHNYIEKFLLLFMGKRKVLNESALKELQMPQEGEMFG